MDLILTCIGLVIFVACARALTDSARALEQGARALSVLSDRRFVWTEDIEQSLTGIQHAIAHINNNGSSIGTPP